jgi:hypothetical protein
VKHLFGHSAIGIATDAVVVGEAQAARPVHRRPIAARIKKVARMTDPDPDWETYARVQDQLARKNKVDSYTWGLEAALERLLDPKTAAEQAERTIRSESRKERYRAAMLRRHRIARPITDERSAVEARHALRAIEAEASQEQWTLLSAIGHGESYDQLGITIGIAAGAVRARVFRLRRRFREYSLNITR